MTALLLAVLQKGASDEGDQEEVVPCPWKWDGTMSMEEKNAMSMAKRKRSKRLLRRRKNTRQDYLI